MTCNYDSKLTSNLLLFVYMIFVSSLEWQELAGALKEWSRKVEMISVKVDRPNLQFFLKIWPDQVLDFLPLLASLFCSFVLKAAKIPKLFLRKVGYCMKLVFIFSLR